MKNIFLKCFAATVIAGFAQAAGAANELSVYVETTAAEASALSIKLNDGTAKPFNTKGLVFFDLAEGQHVLELTNRGQLLRRYEFQSKPQHHVDIAVVMTTAAEPELSLESYIPGEALQLKRRGTSGTIEGVVRANGLPISGATVRIVQLNIEEETSFSGQYSLTIPRGVYKLEVVHPNFGSDSASNYRVIAGNTGRQNFSIDRQTREIEEVTVVAKIKTSAFSESERYSADVIDTMDVTEMERAGDSDVAAGLSRIVGVTVQKGKYANVRGLDGRYISSTLNGMLMPSTDPMRRDVQLDLFPTTIIGAVEIQKTYSPDLLGSTTGGAVKMKTRGLPDQKITKFSLSQSYNFDFTGDDIISYRSSDDDWSGYDSGLRDLPEQVLAATKGGRSLTICDISIDAERCTDPRQAAALAVQFQDDYNLRMKKSNPDVSMSLVHGDRLEMDSGEFAYYGTLGYKNTTKNRLDGKLSDPLGTSGKYSRSVENININGYFVTGFQFDGGDEILSKTIYLHNTDDKARQDIGIDDEDNEVQRVILEWVERELMAQHFSGSHAIATSEQDHQLDWRIGYSVTDRHEPDRRTYTYLNGNLATSSLERRWSEMTEDSVDVVIDYTLPMNVSDNIFVEFTAGALYSDRSREVELYRFGIGRGDRADDISFSDEQDLESVLSYQNFALDRVRLSANTTNTDAYNADEDINAFYLNGTVEFGENMIVVAGLRQEEFNQNLTYPNEKAASNILSSQETLPSIGLTYLFNEKLQLRMAYSSTVSYPGIIERSESLSFDPETDEPIFGNSALKVSNIDNYDMRLEYYYSDSESISLAYFYKEMTDPIERAVPDASGSAAKGITFRNALSAELTGIELDFTKNLIDRSELLVFIGANISYIDSEVDLDDDSLRLEGIDSKNRELQGQSPLLANIRFGFDDYDSEQKFTLLINYFDDRIFQVTRGDNNGPRYEVGQVQVDLNYEKTVYLDEDVMVFKAQIKNLLNEDVQWKQNNVVTESYQEGTSLSLSFSYEF